MSEPYIEDGWLCEPCEPDYAPGISQAIPGSWSKPIVNLAELDGYGELIAAAEQRGAAKALRAVMELHAKRDDLQTRGGKPICDGCGDTEGWASEYPCPTVQTITDQMGEAK